MPTAHTFKTTARSPRHLAGRALLATCGLALAGVALAPALAQDAEGGNTPNGALNIPQNLTIFGHNDPNHRRATAVVNGEIITGTDVEQRLALILAANKQTLSAEETERLRMQVLRNLIDETLEIQEAKANKIDVADSEVDETYNRVATQNFGKSTETLARYLRQIGSSPESLKRQIRGELAWQQLLRRNVQPFINVSQSEVQDMLGRLKAAKGTEEYHPAEIFLAATDENREAVLANANKIVDGIKKGGSFVAYARQFSQSSTASVGGDDGWIRLAMLPPELAQVMQGMAPGQMAGPVSIRGGYSIVYLIDKRQVLTADPRDALLSLKQISLDFPKGTTKEAATARAQQFAAMTKDIKGCGAADEAAHAFGAQVVVNDQIKARDLPGALQDLVLQLSIGQATPPFGSLEEGVRVLMLCGRDDPKIDTGPSADQIMDQMQEDRVNKRAQAYLRDLRRDAVIEYN